MVSEAISDGFALRRRVDLDRQDFAEFVRGTGMLSEHRFGTGSAGLLDLNASENPKKIVTGKSALPLHTDGTLVRTNPTYISLYCKDIRQEPGTGCTHLCLQSELLKPGAPEDLAEMINGHWEYFVTDASHFPHIANRWTSIPAILEPDGEHKRLNIAMPFSSDHGRSGWRVRLPGKSEGESFVQLAELDKYLRSTRSFYSHSWVKGDLLVIDNTRTLHGRSYIEANSIRHLLRGQVDA